MWKPTLLLCIAKPPGYPNFEIQENSIYREEGNTCLSQSQSLIRHCLIVILTVVDYLFITS